ncbi:MAG TPA: hypothetical protein VHZ28_13765 [Terracidiphilus sp.]|jgi:hypothetical protein|nr:hypothetical protein [Terracidiphilus sp.]
MVETLFNNLWAAPMANLPAYGLALVSAPIISFLGIKVLLLAKASSMNKGRREWIFTQERDADGLPVLATVKVRSGRFSIPRSR